MNNVLSQSQSPNLALALIPLLASFTEEVVNAIMDSRHHSSLVSVRLMCVLLVMGEDQQAAEPRWR